MPDNKEKERNFTMKLTERNVFGAIPVFLKAQSILLKD